MVKHRSHKVLTAKTRSDKKLIASQTVQPQIPGTVVVPRVDPLEAVPSD